ncbi:gamma-glutamylcyclotransferase family protein [Parendozoicomonas haliclonae]|uniref:AIG2-like family protein n=1 Tax=Parendozoicomonas haliclonae TaxID=1960125 RepID=A0A1X7ALE2_9GAMM|nr:gamma-glutamylcyclotransferase family protein [Parendozoicomonas haliclonae]SMA48235.1 AIG2-like family protein [Parendozoicomonas haliclonae]
MYYFAYGSNMSLARLRARIPSAEPLGHHQLAQHDLRFHKVGQDGSGKCDACFTGNPSDIIHGVLFRISPHDKQTLDEIEGVGRGYEDQLIEVSNPSGITTSAHTYIATHTSALIKPFSWYVNHVLIGALEQRLPSSYVTAKIKTITTVEDPDRERDNHQRAIHRAAAIG